MNNTLAFINSLFKPQEQWPMSYAENEPGMSLPEYHPEEEAPAVESAPLAADDQPIDVMALIQELLNSRPTNTTGLKPDDITDALNKLLGANPETKAKAQVGMYEGAVMKTVAAASDMFSRALGLAFSGNIDKARDVAVQNYQNQMDALDNQVLYIKHQLADRFNKTIETNIMNLAARNLKVNAGNVLELSKEEAGEITEDMRTAESNARLKQIAFEAGKKQAKESAKYAKTQLWTGLAQSALNLGIMYQTGGGTMESFGDLYKGYKMGKATLAKSFNEIY